jgi:sulfate transport system permease protein
MKSSKLVKFFLIGIMILFLGIFVVLPMISLLVNAFKEGLKVYFNAIVHPETLHALQLNLIVAVFSIPLNLFFGVVCAILISRFEFRAKNILLTLIDLPFSVSAVISGLIFILVFGLDGWLGKWIEEKGFQVIFATPGIVLATIFVTFPFIVREVLPVLEASGDEEEQAAFTLGANSLQIFYYITLPKIKWGLLYGVILSTARVMGEYGAVSLVSGHISGLTDTLPLRIDKLYNEYQATSAFAVSTILVGFAFVTLMLKLFIEQLKRKSHS